MKIVIEEIKNIEETEVIIRTSKIDDAVKRIEKTLKLIDDHLLGRIDENQFSLLPGEIYYFESIDNKVFAYTVKAVYETIYKLYELEETLDSSIFLRVNKNTILNTAKIRFFKSSINGRVEATLKNDEIIVISRTYVSALKMMLGGKNK